MLNFLKTGNINFNRIFITYPRFIYNKFTKFGINSFIYFLGFMVYLYNFLIIYNINEIFLNTIGFQEPATLRMEGLINLHNYIFFYLILIFIFVSWIAFYIFIGFYYIPTYIYDSFMTYKLTKKNSFMEIFLKCFLLISFYIEKKSLNFEFQYIEFIFYIFIFMFENLKKNLIFLNKFLEKLELTDIDEYIPYYIIYIMMIDNLIIKIYRYEIFLNIYFDYENLLTLREYSTLDEADLHYLLNFLGSLLEHYYFKEIDSFNLIKEDKELQLIFDNKPTKIINMPTFYKNNVNALNIENIFFYKEIVKKMTLNFKLNKDDMMDIIFKKSYQPVSFSIKYLNNRIIKRKLLFFQKFLFNFIIYKYFWFLIIKAHHKHLLISRKITHHSKLELIWTFTPSGFLTFIAFPSIIYLYEGEELISVYIYLKVSGFQWFWIYEYIYYKLEELYYFIKSLLVKFFINNDNNNSFSEKFKKFLNLIKNLILDFFYSLYRLYERIRVVILTIYYVFKNIIDYFYDEFYNPLKNTFKEFFNNLKYIIKEFFLLIYNRLFRDLFKILKWIIKTILTYIIDFIRIEVYSGLCELKESFFFMKKVLFGPSYEEFHLLELKFAFIEIQNEILMESNKRLRHENRVYKEYQFRKTLLISQDHGDPFREFSPIPKSIPNDHWNPRNRWKNEKGEDMRQFNPYTMRISGHGLPPHLYWIFNVIQDPHNPVWTPKNQSYMDPINFDQYYKDLHAEFLLIYGTELEIYYATLVDNELKQMMENFRKILNYPDFMKLSTKESIFKEIKDFFTSLDFRITGTTEEYNLKRKEFTDFLEEIKQNSRLTQKEKNLLLDISHISLFCIDNFEKIFITLLVLGIFLKKGDVIIPYLFELIKIVMGGDPIIYDIFNTFDELFGDYINSEGMFKETNKSILNDTITNNVNTDTNIENTKKPMTLKEKKQYYANIIDYTYVVLFFVIVIPLVLIK